MAQSCRLSLEYKASIENIYRYCNAIYGSFMSNYDHELRIGDMFLYVCLPVVWNHQAKYVVLTNEQNNGTIIQ